MNKEKLIVSQDNKATLTHVSNLVHKLASLYQIPNWSAEHSVNLGEWIVENYRFESLEAVERCLKNPPELENKSTRLTPDTIRLWMRITLEKESEKRERELSKAKQKYVSEAAEQYQAIDWKPSIYRNVDKLLEGFLNKLKPSPSKEIDWEEVRTDTARWKANRAKFEKQFEKR